MAQTTLLRGDNVPMRGVLPETIDLGHQACYDVILGLRDQNYILQAAGSYGGSNSSWNWNINLNNQQTAYHKLMLVRTEMQAVLTGVAPAVGNLLKVPFNGTIALRHWGMNQCIQTANVQLNAVPVVSSPNLIIRAMAHLGSCENRNMNQINTSPTLPDNAQSYAEGFESSTNPLNDWQSSDYYQQGRGCYPITVVSNSPTSATIQWTHVEPILVSPFATNYDDMGKAFTHLSNMSIQLGMGNLQRFLSIDPVNMNPLTSLVVTPLTPPDLLIQVMNPHPQYSIPDTVAYPVSVIQDYPNPTQAPLAAGAIASLIPTNSQPISFIPSKIIIFVSRAASEYSADGGYTLSDCFAEIQNISITFGVNSILASATPQDLWRLSQENGCNIPYSAWFGRGPTSVTDGVFPSQLGSVIVLDPSKDFGLPLGQVPGTFGQQNFLQIRVTYRNPAAVAVSYTTTVISVQDSVLLLRNQGSSLEASAFTADDVINLRPDEMISWAHHMTVYGGARAGNKFFDSVKRHIPDVLRTAKQVLREVGEFSKLVVPIVKTIAGAGRKGPHYPRSRRGGNLAEEDDQVDQYVGGKMVKAPSALDRYYK